MHTDRPLIGITSKPNPDEALWTMADDRYIACVEEAGGAPMIFPTGHDAAALADELAAHVDGILFTGGGDICENSFGGHPYASSSTAPIANTDEGRDAFEWALLRAAWQRNLPCLGVCRGLQAMNVTFGGTLVRDMSGYPTQTLPHQRFDQADVPVHHVRIQDTSRLAAILGTTELEVNSLHHQAIFEQSPVGRVVAWAEDGTPEGIEFPERDFFLGVQWHPERLRTQPQLFEALVDAARDYRYGRTPEK